jgi:hopanoid biosynthesis associated protein HpnK
MVAGDQAADAISRARHLPRLGVGLHVVVTRGNPILPPDRIPSLLDDKARFDDNLVRAGFRYFFCPSARRQLAEEIQAQFDAFAKSGLDLDHVNAHNHMHLHPTVLSLIIRIGREHGMKAIRLPFEPSFSLGGIFIGPWVALVKYKLRKAGIRYNDFVFGISSVGKMNKQKMLETIATLPDGISEIFTHPATKAWPGTEPEAALYLFEDELNALTDAEVRDQVTRTGAKLITFKSIPKKE